MHESVTKESTVTHMKEDDRHTHPVNNDTTKMEPPEYFKVCKVGIVKFGWFKTHYHPSAIKMVWSYICAFLFLECVATVNAVCIHSSIRSI